MDSNTAFEQAYRNGYNAALRSRCGTDPVLVNPATADFGSVLVCAVRYAIGRQTYMPALVAGFIRPLIPNLDDGALMGIYDAVEPALTKDPERNAVWTPIRQAILEEYNGHRLTSKGES